MKKLYMLSALSLLQLGTIAQVMVDNTQTVQSFVEDIFLGNGIFVDNITFNGAPADLIHDQFGAFTDSANGIGLGGGLCMSTGLLSAMALNGEEWNGPSMPYTFQDPDVLALLSNEFSLGDLASLEFDFIATGNICNFQYVFASDEYPEFVESAFNDHFGFFVSGPEIFGPYSNGAVNIALIPGTTESVGINTLNAAEHAEFYIDNSLYNTSVGFDAFTTVLNAHIENLLVGEIYHVKLVIADVSDSALDSGVFLRGDSFQQECSEIGAGGMMTETCMLSSLNAEVHYTENCGTISLTNLSELNIETTNCYYEMGDGNTTAACDASTLYTYAMPGTYTLKLVYEVGTFKTKFTIADIIISDTPATIPVIGYDENDQLNVSNYDGTSSLQWYLDGVAIPGAIGVGFIVDAPGSYTVVANNGCPSTSEVFTVLNIETASAQNLARVFPNPAKGQIQVKANLENCLVMIFNASGQLVTSQSLQAGKTLQIPQTSGIYAVKIMGESGRFTQSKVVVE
jgi:hypothetical protein